MRQRRQHLDQPASERPSSTRRRPTSVDDGLERGRSRRTVAIAETEYKLDPSDPTVKAGSVTFDVTNDGTITHNLEIEGNGVEEDTDDLAPGESAS